MWRDPQTVTVLAPGAIQNWPTGKPQRYKMRSICYVKKTTGYVAPSHVCVLLLFLHYKNVKTKEKDELLQQLRDLIKDQHLIDQLRADNTALRREIWKRVEQYLLDHADAMQLAAFRKMAFQKGYVYPICDCSLCLS